MDKLRIASWSRIEPGVFKVKSSEGYLGDLRELDALLLIETQHLILRRKLFLL